MTHVGMVVPPLQGHVNPALGTAAELARRGHRVTLHLPEAFRDAVEAVGARLHPYRPPPAPVWAGGAARARFAALPARLAHDARAVLPQVLDALAADPPDVLAYDQLCVWGRLAAAVADRPAAMLCTSYTAGSSWSPWQHPAYSGLVASREADAAWTSAIDDLATGFGTPRLAVPDLLGGVESTTVVFVPRILHPAAAAYDGRYAFVGPAVRPGPVSVSVSVDGLDDRPLVHVSMGTLFADWPELVPLTERAFADARWQVLLAAPGEEPADRGGFHVRPSWPQLAVLDRAAVSVTHGGMGSVLEALRAGVPLVVVPQVPEQEITADRVVALGLGVALRRGTVTPDVLRAAVEHVTTDPRCLRAVLRMRATVRACGGASAAADALLATRAAGGVGLRRL